VGWWLIGIEIALGASGFAGVLGSLGSALGDGSTTAPHSTPATFTVPLESGDWAVYQYTGNTQQVGPVTRTSNRSVTLSARQVTITSPSGQAITATGSTVNETITLDGAIYTAAAIFTVAEPGSYRVEVTKQVGDVRVAPRVTSIFGGAAWWFVAIALGGLLFVAGIITAIVGARGSRTPPTAWGPGGPGGPAYGAGPSPYPPGQPGYPTGPSTYPPGQPGYPTGQAPYPPGPGPWTPPSGPPGSSPWGAPPAS
jgi:hypothetical protein